MGWSPAEPIGFLWFDRFGIAGEAALFDTAEKFDAKLNFLPPATLSVNLLPAI